MKTNISLALVILLTAFFAAGCKNDPHVGSTQEPSLSTENISDSVWEELAKGLSYKTFHISASPEDAAEKDLMLIIIDPKLFSFSISENETTDSAKTIKEIHEEKGAIVSFNGGFFTEDFKPTGLLISNGKELRKVSNADLLNGIIAIDTLGQIRFLKETEKIDPSSYEFAIQNGPVLIDENGTIQISEDTGKTASRTALGIDNKGDLVLIILKQSLLNSDNTISLYQFAHLLKEGPEFTEFGLHSVLNLDGGPSTGLMLGDHYYPEMEKVQNVVIVKKR